MGRLQDELMKRKVIAIAGAGVIVAAGIVLVAVRLHAAPTSHLDTPKEKASYAMGVAMARQLKRPGVELDLESLAKGLKHEFSGRDLLMTEDALLAAINAFQEDLKQKQTQALKTAAEANSKQGKAFLAQNAREEGVVILGSGLQYKILTAGNGKQPSDTDTVECRYRGAHLDGAEFEGSQPDGKSVTLPITELIPGWREAVKLMPVGSKWKLFVPPELAYGERGFPSRKGGVPAIGPSETLVFELELLAIRPSTGARQQTAPAKMLSGEKKD
jgi:FKBP-type peptidyl-prolyl cis-trans isomerase